MTIQGGSVRQPCGTMPLADKKHRQSPNRARRRRRRRNTRRRRTARRRRLQRAVRELRPPAPTVATRRLPAALPVSSSCPRPAPVAFLPGVRAGAAADARAADAAERHLAGDLARSRRRRRKRKRRPLPSLSTPRPRPTTRANTRLPPAYLRRRLSCSRRSRARRCAAGGARRRGTRVAPGDPEHEPQPAPLRARNGNGGGAERRNAAFTGLITRPARPADGDHGLRDGGRARPWGGAVGVPARHEEASRNHQRSEPDAAAASPCCPASLPCSGRWSAALCAGTAASDARPATSWGDLGHFGELLAANSTAPIAAFGVNPEDGSVMGRRHCRSQRTGEEVCACRSSKRSARAWKAVASRTLGATETTQEAAK